MYISLALKVKPSKANKLLRKLRMYRVNAGKTIVIKKEIWYAVQFHGTLILRQTSSTRPV